MENNKKDRTQLKSYFKSNAVPTEQNFKDLIDANLNQKEDGIVKIPNGALAVQSASTTEELIHFYKSFDDANPTWKLSQKPTDRAGFNLSDGAGTSRLFVENSTGNVGLSTNTPVAKLDVNTKTPNGVLIRSGNSSGSTVNSQLTLGYDGTSQYRHAIKTRHHNGQTATNAIDFYLWKQGTDTADTIGTLHAMTLDGNGNVGLSGVNAPSAKLHIAASGGVNPASNGIYVLNPATTAGQDAIIAARVTGAAAGNPFISLDVSGVIGWSIGIDNADSQSLKFSNSWSSLTDAPKMTLHKTGSLGLGTTAPAGRLDVNTLDANGVIIRGGNGYTGTDYSQLTLGYNGTPEYRHAIKTRHHGSDGFYNGIDFYIWTQADAKEKVGSKFGMSITGRGLGIGLNQPTAKLHVLSSGNANPETNGLYVFNPNAVTTEDSILGVRTTSGGGNPFVSFDIAGIAGWSMGIDSKDNHTFKFANAWNNVAANTRMSITKTGYVGIGTTAPRWPLHVAGTASTGVLYGNGAYMNVDKYENVWDNAVATNISIMAEDSVGARNNFVVHNNILSGSDARIKNVIGRSNIQEDLAILMQIPVTEYQYKDVRKKGTRIEKKIIAQEIEAIYPRAIRKRVDTIPDIYENAVSTVFDAERQELTIELAKAPELEAGDQVEIISNDNRAHYEVLSVNENVFTVKSEEDPGPVFIYGKEVNDFRFVDYDSLFMLGISSIQALNGEVNSLKDEVSGLKKALANYSA